MSSGGILKQRWWSGLPVWLEVCLRAPMALVGRLLVLLQFRVCWALWQLVLCTALSIPLMSMLVRRKWRRPLLYRRNQLLRAPVPKGRQSWGIKESIRQMLQSLAYGMGWVDRRVIRPVLQFMLCTMLALVLPCLVSRRGWRTALFGRRQRPRRV